MLEVEDINNHNQFQQYKNEYHRRKSQYGAQVVVSHREGNSGGTGEGMQYQQELISPLDLNEPIEGILISEEEKRIAPILQIQI